MTVNRLRQRLAAGQEAVGGWCSVPSLLHTELYAAEGFDYVCVDCQHGVIGDEAMVPMLAAVARTETTPVVRVPSNDGGAIGKALDAGAEAVIVPMVESAADAARAAEACRYAPAGRRSWGPVRSRLFLNAGATGDTDAEVMCVVMVETVAGVEAVEDICATPGVDGVYVGPADLAVSMGAQPGAPRLPAAHAEAVAHVLRTCQARGVVPGIHTSGGVEARRRLDQGFRMVSVSTDLAILRDAAAAHLRAARGQPAE